MLSQSPDQGSQVDVGTEVNISVSNGLVEVPNVVGSSESSARSALSNVGLDVSVQSQPDDSTAGTVIGQSPNAGNTVQRGSTVTITVSTGPTPTTTSSQQPANPERQGQSASPTEPSGLNSTPSTTQSATKGN